VPYLIDVINEIKISKPHDALPARGTIVGMVGRSSFNRDKRKSVMPVTRDERVADMMNRLNTKGKPRGSVMHIIKQKFKSSNSSAKVSPAPQILLNSDTKLDHSFSTEPMLERSYTSHSENCDQIMHLQSNLVKAGEIVKETLPLLNILVAPEIEDSPITANIGPDGRTFLLSGLLVRLIEKIASHQKIAIVIDNTQWMDSASWAILMNVLRRCQRAMIVLTAGPCNNWRQTLLKEYRDKEDTESVILRGFNVVDLEQQLTSQFFWIDSVSKDLLDFIKDATEGFTY
jgi:ABC-type transporter Mla MlaB component